MNKCPPGKRQHIRETAEKQPFSELESSISQIPLELVKRMARRELENNKWLPEVARLSGRDYEQPRVKILEVLDTDVINLSGVACDSFLGPLIESRGIDLSSFNMEVLVNKRLAPGQPPECEFTQKQPERSHENELGLVECLAEAALSGNVSQAETEFLRRMSFYNRRP